MLHLRLARRYDATARPLDLLITDVYGEAFRLASDSEDECRSLHIFRRADHVSILLDGAKLRDPRCRQEPFNSADALLRIATDTRMLDSSSNVQLVVTKRDLLCGMGSDALNRFIANKRPWLEDRYINRVGSLRWFEVAARSEVANVSPAFGLDGLLSHWVEVSRRFHASSSSPKSPPRFATEFDRYSAVKPVVGEGPDA
jgi:hypothetical protein